MNHRAACRFCKASNSFKATLSDRFLYRIGDAGSWNMLTDPPSLVERQKPSLRGSSGHPIKSVKKVLRGMDKYTQSQLFGYVFEMIVPRDIAPLGDSPLIPPLYVSAIYIDKNGKIDDVHYDHIISANPLPYQDREARWSKYIGQLRDYKKEHWGSVKVIWDNSKLKEIIAPQAARIAQARARIAVILNGNRFIDPQTRQIIRHKNGLREETVFTCDLLQDTPSEYYFDGLYKHTVPGEPATKFGDIYAAKLRVQMQSCVAYKSVLKDVDVRRGNNLRGTVTSFPSNGDEINIINEL